MIKKSKALKAPKVPKGPRKTLKEKLNEYYELGRNHGYNSGNDRAAIAERELQKAQDRVYILEGDMEHVRKALKPAAKLIEAATNFLDSPAMSYVKKFNVSAGGMGNNTQDTTCVSINIEMLEAHTQGSVSDVNVTRRFE